MNDELTEASCYGDVATHFYPGYRYCDPDLKEKKMIFEIACDCGYIQLNIYEDRNEWLDAEKDEVKGTPLEKDSVKYLEQFIKSFRCHNVDLKVFQGKILIEGETIMPKIKSTINVIDL